MKDRCLNPKSNGYYKYGARGITVCERWLVFANFLADMGARPTAKHSIDRKDNNAGYCKENCRWATSKEQSRNKRNNVFLEVGGVRKLRLEWAEILGVSVDALRCRSLRGWSDEEVLKELNAPLLPTKKG